MEPLNKILPVPLQRMVETWGTKTESKLNSKDAVRWLTQCSGITAKKAAAIKEAWDATKGGCLGVAAGQRSYRRRMGRDAAGRWAR